MVPGIVNVSNSEQNHSLICCCSKKDIPHDESNKFQLKALEENDKNLIIFKDRKYGGELEEMHVKNS